MKTKIKNFFIIIWKYILSVLKSFAGGFVFELMNSKEFEKLKQDLKNSVLDNKEQQKTEK